MLMRSEIKVTHLPSGESVTAKFARSQHKNKDAAVKVLASRLRAKKIGLEKPVMDEEIEGTRCPICEEGVLIEKTELNQYLVGGERFEIPSHFCQCDYCGSDQASPSQVSQNAAYMAAAKDYAWQLRGRAAGNMDVEILNK